MTQMHGIRFNNICRVIITPYYGSISTDMFHIRTLCFNMNSVLFGKYVYSTSRDLIGINSFYANNIALCSD